MLYKTSLAILALGLSLAGDSLAFAADKLEVATSSQGSLATIAYVAKQLGYFDAVGLDVDIFDGGGGSNAVAAVVGGSAQIGFVGIKNASEATAKGQILKVIGTGIQGFPASILVQTDALKQSGLVPESPIAQRSAFLKGKTVAVNDIGGSSGDFVRYALSNANLTDHDITLINLNTSPGRLAGLKAKRLDAIVGNSPDPEIAVSSGYGAVLIDAAKDVPTLKPMEYMIQAAREDYIKQNPSIIERYLTALARAENTISADPDKAKKAYYDYLAAQAHGVKAIPAIADLAWKNNLPYIPKTVVLAKPGLEIARKFFAISDKAPDDVLVDNSYAEKAQKAAAGQ